MILYIATSNPGKLRDFAIATKELNVELQPLPGLTRIPAPVEDAPTFDGNARAKATYYSGYAPDQIVIADDSGLEVDALGGEPGVRSARYAQDAGFTSDKPVSADERNNLYLLSRLHAVRQEKRGARYRCVLAGARNGVSLYTGEGSVEGEILTSPRGEGGFGYDPLFYLPSLEQTMAEIDLTTKDGLSHRGRALRNLLFAMYAARAPR
ncbi:MAG TPA: non-canonical purine NTP pyrophosphatase [Acidobacteriaceae bacterium]|nr:non-canonical purine NTP pyrophosphatase [Acidobacteriaceae bacterium]